MPIDLTKIDAIIFDLGGVILNLDHEAPVRAFAELGIPDFEKYYSKVDQSTLFVDLEKGKISPAEFREELRKYLPIEITDESIDKAWNSIILDIPKSRVLLLEQLRDSHSIYLLSNTNILHYQVFSNFLKDHFGYGSLGDLMDEAFYSHELGLRKPDPAIFEYVIAKTKVNPGRALFIDDTEEHILTAQKLGLHTHHLKDAETIEEILSQSK